MYTICRSLRVQMHIIRFSNFQVHFEELRAKHLWKLGFKSLTSKCASVAEWSKRWSILQLVSVQNPATGEIYPDRDQYPHNYNHKLTDYKTTPNTGCSDSINPPFLVLPKGLDQTKIGTCSLISWIIRSRHYLIIKLKTKSQTQVSFRIP